MEIANEETIQSDILQVLSLIKSMVSEEDVRLRILYSSLDKLDYIKKRVTFLDRNSEINYLRATAKRYCINFLQSTCKK